MPQTKVAAKKSVTTMASANRIVSLEWRSPISHEMLKAKFQMKQSANDFACSNFFNAIFKFEKGLEPEDCAIFIDQVEGALTAKDNKRYKLDKDDKKDRGKPLCCFASVCIHLNKFGTVSAAACVRPRPTCVRLPARRTQVGRLTYAFR